MNFSTAPPCRSSAARAASKYERISSNTDSASAASPIAVDPDRSQNTEVTSLRRSTAGVRAPRRKPCRTGVRRSSRPALGADQHALSLEPGSRSGHSPARQTQCQETTVALVYVISRRWSGPPPRRPVRPRRRDEAR